MLCILSAYSERADKGALSSSLSGCQPAYLLIKSERIITEPFPMARTVLNFNGFSYCSRSNGEARNFERCDTNRKSHQKSLAYFRSFFTKRQNQKEKGGMAQCPSKYTPTQKPNLLPVVNRCTRHNRVKSLPLSNLSVPPSYIRY